MVVVTIDLSHHVLEIQHRLLLVRMAANHAMCHQQNMRADPNFAGALAGAHTP